MNEKQNFGIRVDLLKLRNAFMHNFKGKTATKRCVVIPVDDCPEIFLGEKGCYLNMTAFEVNNPQYGDTHFVKGSLPKEVRDAMTDEERSAQPIIGNMRPLQAQQMTVTGVTVASEEDEVPF